MMRSEGCSRICCVAVSEERWARSFFMSVLLLEEGAGAAAAGLEDAEDGLETEGPELLDRCADDLLLEELLLFFLGSSCFCTSLYEVDGRGSVSRAFWRADVNSDFSSRCVESMPYS